MKEDFTKELIKESTIKTSDDFTDKLMLKIETEKAKEPVTGVQHIRMYRFAILGIVGVGVVFFLMMYLDLLPELNILNVQLKISKTPLLIVTTMFLLLVTNHILKLHYFSRLHGKS